MGYRRSKYSEETNQRLAVMALIALKEGTRPMTRDEVSAASPALAGVTPQKVSMVLNELCEKGVARKGKGKDGRMRYGVE